MGDKIEMPMAAPAGIREMKLQPTTTTPPAVEVQRAARGMARRPGCPDPGARGQEGQHETDGDGGWWSGSTRDALKRMHSSYAIESRAPQSFTATELHHERHRTAESPLAQEPPEA